MSSAPAITHVGFIGLGIMGRPMTRNLLKAGFDVTVHSRTRSKVDELAGEGAHAADSPAAVAERSDLVITMVPDSSDVELVARGPKGVFEGLRTGAIVADMSTISPSVTRALADDAASRGASWLDAPVSGGDSGAIAGTLTIMVGGDAAAFERARPVFQAMGKRITHIGPSGHGQTAKLCNQILVAVNLLATSESLVLAAKAGLDLERLHQALSGGAGNSWSFENLGRKMLARDFTPGFRVELHDKDMAIVTSAAREAGVVIPLGAAVAQLIAALRAQGDGGQDHSALLDLVTRLSGR